MYDAGGYYLEALNQIVGDYYFTCDALKIADIMTELGSKVFVYLFDQVRSHSVMCCDEEELFAALLDNAVAQLDRCHARL